MKQQKGGKVRTRASLKSRAKSYRRHRSTSKCRGKPAGACRRAPGCKVASGTKRKFCRKVHNTKTRRQTRKQARKARSSKRR